MADDTVIATGACLVNGVRAANEGDEVPAELAKKYDWPVARKGTKAAAEALPDDNG